MEIAKIQSYPFTENEGPADTSSYQGCDTMFRNLCSYWVRKLYQPEFLENLRRAVPYDEIALLHSLFPFSSEIQVTSRYKKALVIAATILKSKMPEIRERLWLETDRRIEVEKYQRKKKIQGYIFTIVRNALNQNSKRLDNKSTRLRALFNEDVDSISTQRSIPQKMFSFFQRNIFPPNYLEGIPLFRRLERRISLIFQEDSQFKTYFSETGIRNEIARLFLVQIEKNQQGLTIFQNYKHFLSRAQYTLLNKVLTDENLDEIIRLTIELGNISAGYDQDEINSVFDSKLRQEARNFLTRDLRMVYYQSMFIVTHIILKYNIGSHNMQEELKFYREFEELIENPPDEISLEYLKRLEERALFWYQKILPENKGFAIADRREIPYETRVYGFEFCRYTPSNYEIAILADSNLPQGLSMNQIPAIRYIDMSIAEHLEEHPEIGDKQKIIFTHGICTHENQIILYKHPALTQALEVYQKIPKEYVIISQINDLRHELAHAWQNVMFERYPDLLKHFLDLLKKDYEDVNKDIFSPELSLSSYPKERLEALDEERYIKEVIAVLWSISFNSKNRSIVETELPHEYIILLCMTNKDYFEKFLSEHDITC